MTTSIAILNSSIELKKNNGVNGFNYYQWLKSARLSNPLFSSSLKEAWLKICFANITQTKCFTQIPIN